MQVLILFGSNSDSVCYDRIISGLKEKKIQFDFHVCSSHKTFSQLTGILSKTKADLFIAGAGLAAALPGVIAAQTTKPVIGVPCLGAFDGLDAFLTIAQMPPGIPVATVAMTPDPPSLAAGK